MIGADAARCRGAGLGDEADGSEGEPAGPSRVSNVVFMGMGEALANYKAAIGAIRRLTDPAPDGLGISARGITMSTVGLVPGIDKLAAEGIPVTLALSLHAPDDELRDELVPINTRWKVDEALDAAYRYYEATGRRVSIEYALIRDINDQAWRADLLGEKLNAPRARLGARQPDPAQPDAGLEVDRVAAPASSSSSSSGCGPTASRRRCATPAGPTSTAPAASWRRRPPEPPYPVQVRRPLTVVTATLALVLAGCGTGADLPAGLRGADSHATSHAAAPSTAVTKAAVKEVPLRAGERFQSIRLRSAYTPKAPTAHGHRRLPVLRPRPGLRHRPGDTN